MLVYPFVPEESGIYAIDGFDTKRKSAGAPLLILPENVSCPADYHGFLFSEVHGMQERTEAEQILHICITSEVIGGCFDDYLCDMLSQYGPTLWLYLLPLRHVFSLPAKDPGIPLSRDELQEILFSHTSHFSRLLLCRYCMLDVAGQQKLVLFDTSKTLREKLQHAEKAGIQRCFGWIKP